VVKTLYSQEPNTLARYDLMMAAPSEDSNVFKQIFVDHGDGFKHVHPRYNTRSYDGLIHKMLNCGHPDKMGYLEYHCEHCGQGQHLVSMSCQSSLCLRCAKVSVDNWGAQVSKTLHEGVIYRHIVLTVPAVLRTSFYRNAHVLLSPFMPCGVHCLDDVFRRLSGRPLTGGSTVVVQTHGRHGQYTPPLHIIATSGGLDTQANEWMHLDYLPYPMLRKKWQGYVWTMLRHTVKTKEMDRLVDLCDTRYQNGFVTNVQKGDVPSR